MKRPPSVERREGTSHLSLRGRLEPDLLLLLIEQLAQFTKSDAPLLLEMTGAEIDDQKLLAPLIRSLCATAERLGGLEIHSAPPVLVKGLDDCGALNGPSAIRLL